jgi:hypothetical protein
VEESEMSSWSVPTCCDEFDKHARNAGKAGLGIGWFVKIPPRTATRRFILECRTAEQAASGGNGEAGSFIHFCPWCGRELKSLFKD